ncbi:SIMPL domain-containing protein [Actinomadura hibisca]|uniref:SIMPL domain-containing protein n=1 Tax=Actinomadura hibisca TaxID=68565 RepID=UPI00082D6D06|nr:SIMPL domain-containing protein [Actinomadura hibisca]
MSNTKIMRMAAAAALVLAGAVPAALPAQADAADRTTGKATGQTAAQTAGQAAGKRREDRIEVTGVGRVPVRPDIMYVRAGVELTRSAPGDAYQAVGTAAARLVKVITDSGVAARDVKTTDLSVQPEYTTTEPRTVSGYRGSESVSATVRDLPRAHVTLNAIMAAGPDVRLDGVTFDKADVSAELARAQELAVADARAKAQRVARLAGRKLGRVVTLRLVTVDALPPHLIPKAMIADAGGHLSPGEGEQRVTAEVVYALK